MWDMTIHPLKEPHDPVATTKQPVGSALIPNVTARPNLPYIVRFGPYHPYSFVSGNASPHLSLTPQNAYDKLATSTLNKASYQSLTRRCGIWQRWSGSLGLCPDIILLYDWLWWQSFEPETFFGSCKLIPVELLPRWRRIPQPSIFCLPLDFSLMADDEIMALHKQANVDHK